MDPDRHAIARTAEELFLLRRLGEQRRSASAKLRIDRIAAKPSGKTLRAGMTTSGPASCTFDSAEQTT